MICKKAMKIAMGVGMVLCATASFAGRTESFEAALDGNIWSGDITDALVTGMPTEPAVGFPIATNHTQVLNVEGSVICSNTTSSAQSSVSDFLIFIPEPSDELDGEDLTGAKVAIAAGTNWVDQAETKVKLCLYCKEGENAAAWHEIAEVTTSTWLRVTLVFKDDRCRVSLDGEPVHNNFGYKTSTDTGTGGAWYKLAGTGNSVQSLSFIGCAKLDDVVIKDEFAEDAFPATAVATLTGKNEEVSYNNLNKWGMTSGEIVDNWERVLNETSGMTVGQKIACGYDPNSATKFEPVSITKTAANQATIKFPIESTDELGRYSVTVVGGTATVGDATAVQGEDGFATIDLTGITYTDNSNVIKFILKAEKPTPVNAGAGE